MIVLLMSVFTTSFLSFAGPSFYSETLLLDAVSRCSVAEIKQVEADYPGSIKQNSTRRLTSAMRHALLYCDESVVDFLIEKGGLSIEPFFGEETHLMAAAEACNSSVLKKLIQSGADVNELTDSGFSALSKSASRCDIGVVELIVKSTEEKLPTSTNVRSPLESAALNDKYGEEIFFYLISKGYTLPQDVNTALGYACQKGHLKIVNFIIQQSDFQLNNGHIRLLISSGQLSKSQIEKYLQDFEQVTEAELLHALAASQRLDLFKYFYQKLGAPDINGIVDDRSNGLLHTLVMDRYSRSKHKGGPTEFIQFLIDLGADIAKVNDDGKDIFDVASNGPALSLLKIGYPSAKLAYNFVGWRPNLNAFKLFAANEHFDWDEFFNRPTKPHYFEPVLSIYEEIYEDSRNLLDDWVPLFPENYRPNAGTVLKFIDALFENCRNQYDVYFPLPDIRNRFQANKKNFIHLVRNYGLSKEKKQLVINSLLHNSDRCMVGEQVDYLLNEGLELDFVDENGNSPLSIALYNEADSYLIETIVDHEGYRPPLLYNGEYKGFVRKLYISGRTETIEKIVHLDNVKYTRGKPNLFLLEFKMPGSYHPNDNSREKTLEYLIEVGANVNGQDENGDTALHIAARSGDYKWVESLVPIAQINILNDSCETPLAVAISSGNAEMSKFLLENGGLVLSCP